MSKNRDRSLTPAEEEAIHVFGLRMIGVLTRMSNAHTTHQFSDAVDGFDKALNLEDRHMAVIDNLTAEIKEK